jgi:putative DNA primase/helicase
MATAFLRADDIHARIGAAWPSVLSQLGIGEEFLRPKKSGPCPACGGRDRYTFDNRHLRGDFICRGCSPKSGSGFDLLMRVYGWTYSEARRNVVEAAGLAGEPRTPTRLAPAVAQVPEGPATPSDKVRGIVRSACPVSDCPDVVTYLDSRRLWPLPAGCTLRAHPSLEYWHEGERSRFAGLVAEVRDVNGVLVTAHVTYLQDGKKIPGDTPRKMLGKTTGREGCAVQLMPAADVLGIAEGIETALSAAALHEVPVWAALNTSLLAKFEPPTCVKLLHIYADGDRAGLEAAGRLMQRLQDRVRFDLHVPPTPFDDFNDQLVSRSSGQGATHD